MGSALGRSSGFWFGISFLRSEAKKMIFAFLRTLLFLLPFALFGRVVCVDNGDGTWTCSGTGDAPDLPPGIVVTNGLGVCTNCVQMTKSECNEIKQRLHDDIASSRYFVAQTEPTFDLLFAYIDEIKDQVDQVEILDPLYSIRYTLSDLQNSLNGVDFNLENLNYAVEGINCEQCVLEFGGGSGGGGSGGGGSDCCGPCVEQLKALNEVVKSVDNRLKNLGYTVSNISTNVNNILSLFRQYSANVTNSLGRIDSYLRDDLDKYAKNLVSSVLVISNNVDGLQRDFFQAMKYAAEFKNSDGTKDFDPVEISTNFLEVAYYKDLPWAARVEALLLSIAKPFSSSADVDDPQADQKIKDVKDAIDNLNPSQSVSAFSTASESVFGALSRTVSSVAGIFDYAHNPKSVKILESDQWIGGAELTVNLSDDVVDPIRAVFRLIWAVMALVMLFLIWVFVVKTVLPIFNLVRKFVTLLVKA